MDIVLILERLCSLAMLFWIVQAIFYSVIWRFFDHFPQFLESREMPLLSVIVPACNEEETIESALESLLSQSYPALEIILVNDRSTDGTGAIMERLSKRDSRIKLLQIEQLPDKWLGKVHAMAKGVDIAKGEWILCTDADVHFEHQILERSVQYAIRENLDHLSLIPNMIAESALANAAVVTALRGLLIGLQPWKLKDPSSPKAIGVGAFNLLRRSFLQKTEGFEWLRMEVADDIALAQLIKESGGQTECFFAIDSVEVQWYPSLPLAIKGLEKNAFSQLARFSFARGVFLSVLMNLSTSALIASCFLTVKWMVLVWLTLFCSAAISAYFFRKEINLAPRYVFLSFVLGDSLMAFIVLRATILGVLRGGLQWRGTVYSSAQLKEGTRVRF